MRRQISQDHLTSQDEGGQTLGTDPVDSPDDGEGGQHPPAVAHVRQLFRPAVQATWKSTKADDRTNSFRLEKLTSKTSPQNQELRY